ncbi:MAG: hypothetical protein WCP29_07345 [Acidobacteriota bacterium]
MQRLPISLVADGMVVARPIPNPDDPAGMPVCGTGVVLTESLIDRLRDRGIQALSVEGHPVTIEGEASLDDMLAALDHRFRKVTTDPLMQKIKAMFRKQTIRSMEDVGGH